MMTRPWPGATLPANMDYADELAKAKRAAAARSAAARRNRTNAQREDQDAFRFLDRLRRFLLDNGAPGRQKIVIDRAPGDLADAEVRLGWRLATLGVGDQKDHGDTLLVLFSDKTEVAEAEYSGRTIGALVAPRHTAIHPIGGMASAWWRASMDGSEADDTASAGHMEVLGWRT